MICCVGSPFLSFFLIHSQRHSGLVSVKFLWYCLRMSGCHTGCLVIGQCNTYTYPKQGELVRTSKHLLHSLAFHPLNNWAYTRMLHHSERTPHPTPLPTTTTTTTTTYTLSTIILVLSAYPQEPDRQKVIERQDHGIRSPSRRRAIPFPLATGHCTQRLGVLCG